MAIGTNFIRWVFILILVANCPAFRILSAYWALILTHLFSTISLHHLRYLILCHSMLVYSHSAEYVASRGDEPHLISDRYYEIVITSLTIYDGVSCFDICHEPQTTTFSSSCSTICVPIDRSSKVLPGVILEQTVVLY